MLFNSKFNLPNILFNMEKGGNRILEAEPTHISIPNPNHPNNQQQHQSGNPGYQAVQGVQNHQQTGNPTYQVAQQGYLNPQQMGQPQQPIIIQQPVQP